MDDIFAFFKKYERFLKNTDLIMAFGLVGILMIMIVPLPPSICRSKMRILCVEKGWIFRSKDPSLV